MRINVPVVGAVVGILAALVSFSSVADVGVPALRVRCSTNSDSIELEPFIAWNDGNSPYPEFGAEQARAQGMMLEGDNRFYSFATGREVIYALCRSRSRTVRVFATDQQEITVTEQGRAVIDGLPVGDAWNDWAAIYVLRSENPGVWDECFGRRPGGYENLTCVRFDPAKPNSRFLSKSFETPLIDDSVDRGEQPSVPLPEYLVGQWAPYSRSYWGLGDLVIRSDTLSWGECSKVRYRVLRAEGSTFLIELLRSPPCRPGREASFMILELMDLNLEVSICDDQDAFDRPRAERSCSWGILNKESKASVSRSPGAANQQASERGAISNVIHQARSSGIAGSSDESVEERSDSTREQANLPSSVLGVWVPYGRIYQRWGDLTIGPGVLSWYNCLQVPYRVLRTEGRTFLIQLLRSPPCKFVSDANFLVLKLSDDELDVSVCHEQPELSQPLAHGRCSSRGLLYKDKQ